MDADDFCVFKYLYRDASNYKSRALVLLRGPLRAGDAGHIEQTLECELYFIPEAVGLKPLQPALARDNSGPSSDDHSWHEFLGFRAASDDDLSRLPCWGDKDHMIRRFTEVSEWDPTAGLAWEDGGRPYTYS